MLNRRILRIKAFKLVYSYAVTGEGSVEQAYKEMDKSCEAARDLYLYMLALVPALAQEAARRIEMARGKLMPTREDLHPNEKFSSNALAALLASDPDLNKLLADRKLSWQQYDIAVRGIMDRVAQREYFQKYLDSPSSGLKEDCHLMTRIFEDEIVDDSAVADILEELSIYWLDDLAYALTWCCRTFSDLAKGQAWKLPPLYQSELVNGRKPDAGMDSDRDFIRRVLRGAVASYDKYFEKVAEAAAPQWEQERIFATDAAIIACALSERDNCPEVPEPVTLNEWVEISKFYCPPKSRSFINGLLDRFIKNK